MAIKTIHEGVEFGVGDTIRVYQSITEGEKKRLQAFEGMVISIRGKDVNKSFVVRRVGSAQVGIEKIFPLSAPVIDKIEVVKSGVEGVRRAKLYYTREVSKRDVEKIYRRKIKTAGATQSSKPKKRKSSKKSSQKSKKS